MILKSLKVAGFQLFESAFVEFQKLNVVIGRNLDSPNESGNGAAKSTIAKHAITFLLYGKVEGYNLADLISLGKKETSVTGTIEHLNKVYTITREIPTNIIIKENGIELQKANIAGKEIQLNNNDIKQEFLNSIFGDYQYFRKFRCIDDVAGVDLLNQTDAALRKTLMGFLEDEFGKIRDCLLTERNIRTQYSKDKRPYTFYLSEKKLQILKAGLQTLNNQIIASQTELETQQNLVNQLVGKIKANESLLINLEATKDSINRDLLQERANLSTQINELNGFIANKEYMNYSLEITKLEDIIQAYKENKAKIELENKNILKDISITEAQIATINAHIKNEQTKIKDVERNVVNIYSAKTETRCKHCGAIITSENKEACLQELDAEQKQSEKKITDFMQQLTTLNASKTEANKQQKILDNSISESTKKIELAELNLKSLQKKLLAQKERDSNLALLQKDVENHKANISKNEQELRKIEEKLVCIKETLKAASEELQTEQSVAKYYLEDLMILQTKQDNTKHFIMKLNEAFKFSEYKYDKKDLLLYDEAKKTLDVFAGDYIEQWLTNLKIIINNLLEKVNIKANFTNGKEFIEIEENGRQIKYCQLSSGQKLFLGAVFKLAVLIYNGVEGLVLADDGLTKIDIPNLIPFIEVCKNLPLQLIVVYQNCPEIEDVNKIVVERKNNKSEIL